MRQLFAKCCAIFLGLGVGSLLTAPFMTRPVLHAGVGFVFIGIFIYGLGVHAESEDDDEDLDL